MKRTYWTLSLLFALSLIVATSCSGEDPIKAKRIAIENGTYKPKPEPQPEDVYKRQQWDRLSLPLWWDKD